MAAASLPPSSSKAGAERQDRERSWCGPAAEPAQSPARAAEPVLMGLTYFGLLLGFWVFHRACEEERDGLLGQRQPVPAGDFVSWCFSKVFLHGGVSWLRARGEPHPQFGCAGVVPRGQERDAEVRRGGSRLLSALLTTLKRECLLRSVAGARLRGASVQRRVPLDVALVSRAQTAAGAGLSAKRASSGRGSRGSPEPSALSH